MGDRQPSLTIDIGKFDALKQASAFEFSGIITLYGVAALTAADFA